LLGLTAFTEHVTPAPLYAARVVRPPYLKRMKEIANRRQVDLAKKWSVSTGTVSRKLAGESPITVDELLIFCVVFETDPYYLLTGDSLPIPSGGPEIPLPPLATAGTLSPHNPSVPLVRESEEAMPERLAKTWQLMHAIAAHVGADVVSVAINAKLAQLFSEAYPEANLADPKPSGHSGGQQ